MRVTPSKDWSTGEIDLWHQLKQLAQLNLAGTREMKWAELYEAAGARGLTHKQIGDVHGCGKSMITYRLRFGRFLRWLATIVASETPAGLTEWRFREAWDKSGKGNENLRFKRCIPQLLVPFKKNDVSGKIKRQYGDGEKFTPEEAAAELDIPLKSVASTLKAMERGDVIGCRVTSRLAGRTRNYRIHEVFKEGATITREHAEFISKIDAAIQQVRDVVIGSTWAKTSLEIVEGELAGVDKVLDAEKRRLQCQIIDIKTKKKPTVAKK